MKINSVYQLKLFLVLNLFITNATHALTLVYNIKTRRSFGIRADQIQLKKKLKGVAITVVPIIYARNRHVIDDRLKVNVCEHRINGGMLLDLRYMPSKSWWLEATTGIEREWVKARGTSNFNAARTGCDDIVLSGGYNMFPTKNFEIVTYILGGLPTRRKVTLIEQLGTLVGTRFFALGAGAEFSYSFINELKRSFIGLVQVRFLHFFNRKFFPILPCDATIQPGNTTDILITLQYREKKNVIEAGYNATFFTNLAVHLATGTVSDTNFLRNSMYITYARLTKEIPLLKIPGVLGAGLNIGRSKKFDTKIASGWIYMTIIF